MTNDGWGKEWPAKIPPVWPEELKNWPDIKMRKLESYEPAKDVFITKDDLAGGPVFVKTINADGLEQIHNPNGWRIIGIDLASKLDRTIYGAYTKSGFVPLTKEEFENKFKNTSPTHDPYTNPDSQIYYQCNCGAILDPGTKSFAALNNCASEKGWKVRWGNEAYQPYCVECGKDVE